MFQFGAFILFCFMEFIVREMVYKDRTESYSECEDYKKRTAEVPGFTLGEFHSLGGKQSIVFSFVTFFALGR